MGFDDTEVIKVYGRIAVVELTEKNGKNDGQESGHGKCGQEK